MMHWFLCFALIFVLGTSCVRSASYSVGDAGQEFIKTFVDVARKDYGLEIWLQGGGFMGEIKTFSFNFISREKLTQDQARRFYLKVMDRLLSMINSDPKLRPYLKHYPFTHRDVELKLSFFRYSQGKDELCPPYVVYVSSGNDLIFYATRGSEQDSLESLPSESFQRARGIVDHQNSLMQVPAGCGYFGE